MKVNRICKKIGMSGVKYNHDVFLITDDSKDCIDNSIFFAIKGNRVDGHNKIKEAIQNGAKTIVLESKTEEDLGINYIYCKNSKRCLALFLKVFYKKITRSIRMIGVIGTNGKTTTSTLIYHALEYQHKRSMLIGSNGCFSKNYIKKHNNTTPRAVELFSYFCYAHYKKIKYVVMEVSSIAVSELRVLGLNFSCLVYTNFSEDHLDYHVTMDRYLFAKTIPFYKLRENQYAILNADDEHFELFLKYNDAKIKTYGIHNPCDFKANDVTVTEKGIEFIVNRARIKSNLLGEYNVYNLLPLFAISEIFKLNTERVIEFIRDFKQVDGRMNVMELPHHHVIIDYAHTEQAILKTISEVNKIALGDVYVVVGCGGNREKEKRAKIGRILSELDCVPIITSDNPRFEKSMDIIQDILSGVTREVTVIEDRKEAICYGLSQLKKNDYLLILGKGCEDYMDIGGKKEKYSDFQVVETWYRDNLKK